RYLKINVTKYEGRIPKQEATNDDQNTVADVSRNATDNDRRSERTDTEWGHSHTSRERGVVQEILHEQRQNRDCGVKKRANQQHQGIPDSKIAVLENAKIDNRMRRHQFAHEKPNEAGDGDDRP